MGPRGIKGHTGYNGDQVRAVCVWGGDMDRWMDG